MKTLYLTLELLVSRVSFCVVHIILYLNRITVLTWFVISYSSVNLHEIDGNAVLAYQR